jgi:hypothetical protein
VWTEKAFSHIAWSNSADSHRTIGTVDGSALSAVDHGSGE